MLVIVVNAGVAVAPASTEAGYATLLTVIVAAGILLCLTVVVKGWLNEKNAIVFSRITAIILTSLSGHFLMDGLQTIGPLKT